MISAFDLPGFSFELVSMLTHSFPQGEGSTFQNAGDEIVSQTSFLIELLRSVRPAHLLETGTHKGHFCYLARLALPEVRIDTFGIDEGSQRCVDLLNRRLGAYVTFRRGDSKATLSSFHPDYPIDFAWVDGGHDRETCLSDLESCRRLAIPHVCVDDYLGMPSVHDAVNAFVARGHYRVARINEDQRGICYLQSCQDPAGQR